MSDLFTATVYPRMYSYIRKCMRGDDDMMSIALAVAWYTWTRHPTFPIVWHARAAVRAVRNGRDLPGVATNNHQPDAMDHAVTGGGMGGVRYRGPGPAEIAELRDELRHLYSDATDREKSVMDLTYQEYTGREVARTLGIDPGTVVDTKHRIRDRR